MNEILSFFPLFITIIIVGGLVGFANWLLLKRVPDLDHESSLLKKSRTLTEEEQNEK